MRWGNAGRSNISSELMANSMPGMSGVVGRPAGRNHDGLGAVRLVPHDDGVGVEQATGAADMRSPRRRAAVVS